MQEGFDLRKFLRSSLILDIAKHGSDKLRKYCEFAAYDRFPSEDVLQFVNARVSE
jgi:hypothetical protein